MKAGRTEGPARTAGEERTTGPGAGVADRMSLGALARAAGDVLERVQGDEATVVAGLAYDSRIVRAGDLFFCVVGARTDGHLHAGAAAAAGATALVVERPVEVDVAQIVVGDARRALARLAAEWCGRPADVLELIAITGTNGKTTTAWLVESMLRAAGYTTGLIGTVETRIAGTTRPGVRTTPESLDLQLLLADMVAAGVGAVALEATSHALALHRVEGMTFKAAAFTNLSQDHLDFHSGMDDYFEAKRSLFAPERTDRGAVNVDDVFGRKLLSDARVPMIGFGTAPDASVRARNVRLAGRGNEFVLDIAPPAGPRASLQVASRLVGAFNVSNCLAAAAVCLQAGVDLRAIQDGLCSLDAVPGRFESIDRGQPFTVVVDYAHTPDSLDNVLREARRIASHQEGRVAVVFGCGGDRDRGKRPLMGTVAGRLADMVVVTSDNPRSEDPHSIIDQILEGVTATVPGGPDAVIEERVEAITHALGQARAGDVVVIAGKGHESGQELADRTIPFDDRAVARAALLELGWGHA